MSKSGSTASGTFMGLVLFFIGIPVAVIVIACTGLLWLGIFGMSMYGTDTATAASVEPTAAESASYDKAKTLVEKLAARGVFTKINERTLSVVVGTAFYSLDYESKKAACRAMAIVLGGDGALVVPFDLLDHYSNAKIGRYGLWGLKLY